MKILKIFLMLLCAIVYGLPNAGEAPSEGFFEGFANGVLMFWSLVFMIWDNQVVIFNGVGGYYSFGYFMAVLYFLTVVISNERLTSKTKYWYNN